MANEVYSTAETNLIKQTDLATAREIEFVSSFGYSVKKLMELLGVMRLIPKAEGTLLKRHTVTGTLADGKVAEGEIIPLSKYQTVDTPVGEITLNKWRKSTSAEAIIDKGYNQAVLETNEKMKQDVQKGIRADIISSLTISGQPTATGEGLQAALADAWGKLQNIFEDDTVELVFFMNALDLADYLGKAQITVQTAFGLQYIENFLGLGTVILNSGITKGKFFATAKSNMVGYYINVNGGDVADVFDLTTDETGFIGMSEYPDKDRATCNNLVMAGIKIFADNTAGVIAGTITSPLS